VSSYCWECRNGEACSNFQLARRREKGRERERERESQKKGKGNVDLTPYGVRGII